MKLLGSSFDLHLGGEDLMFPHHEDEIAQSEGAGVQEPGKKFVKHWMHGAHLLVEGKKMSKSLGNYFVLRDLTAKGYTGREIRCLLLNAHYRETFNFTIGGLDGARTALGRLDECLGKLREVAGTTLAPAERSLVADFSAALDEDLNVAGAWGVIFEWVRAKNRQLKENTVSPAQAAAALSAWRAVDMVLGIGEARTTEAPAELTDLLAQRLAARQAKDFKRADAIREELKAKGWVIEDTPKGARLKRI